MDDGTIITRSVLSSATGDYPLLAKWLEDVREEARAAGWAKDWPPAEKKDPGD